MERIAGNVRWSERAHFFSGPLNTPVVARVWYFRSERDYDAVEQAEIVAARMVRQFAECAGTFCFLLIASDAATPSILRSTKSAVWEYRCLRKLRHLNSETQCIDGSTRLVTLIDLSRFAFDTDYSALLNWGGSVIVLCNDSIESLLVTVGPWIQCDPNSTVAFDFDAVATSIQMNPMLGLLRYFPPDRSRREAIVVVAHEPFIDDAKQACMDSISRDEG
jgi:hypothetical protein